MAPTPGSRRKRGRKPGKFCTTIWLAPNESEDFRAVHACPNPKSAEVGPEEGELVVTFDGREVTYGYGELDELVLAYATTIHKSQGSEYPAVVIPLTTQHYTMLARNLLYTGVTRGKRLVVLIGQRKALAIAVRNQDARRRWSKLRVWLRP
jgi:ATP-dependent exoDNAse (exonuclease V) alpha subunit